MNYVFEKEMNREISDRTIIDNFAEEFCRVVGRHIKYIVVSGYVAIAHGIGRGTIDVDMIIEKMRERDFAKMHEELVGEGFECLQSSKADDIYEYLIAGDSVRYIRIGEDLPEMEVKFVKDEIDELQMRTRKKFPFTGLDVWFSSIEFNVAFKEGYLKTPKDMEDAKHLRIIYKDELDELLIEDIKKMIKRLRLEDEG